MLAGTSELPEGDPPMFHVTSTSSPRLAALLLSGALLALSWGPAALVVSAQCADPRGNAYCTNGGLANGQNPNPPTNVGQNPNPGGLVNGQNPNPGGLVNGQNPNPGSLVNGQNPNPGGPTNGQNPNPGGPTNGQNPDLPITAPVTAQLSALNGGGAPGDMVVVTGDGFGSNNNIFIDVTDSNGVEWDTDSRAFSCNETDDWVLVTYQEYGLGCSSGVRPGPLDKSASDGTFSGVVMIPTTASVGPAEMCAKGVFATTCTPITITS